MRYVGIMAQRRRNNLRSVALLTLFPCLVIGLIYLFCCLFTLAGGLPDEDGRALVSSPGAFAGVHVERPDANMLFFGCAPYVLAAVGLWFVIAYFANVHIIRRATQSRPLERKENKRVYNLVENLCMVQGMSMPKVNVMDDDSLNAFASGISRQTYTVTLTTGIIKRLDDEELEAVIAHELTHIRNCDVRLMIVSIVFVGIFTVIAQLSLRTLRMQALSSRRRDSKDNKGAIILILIMVIVAAIGYFFSTMMRFAISKKREYMADAGAAEMTRRPWALASALRKIAKDPLVEAISRRDIAQLFIESPSGVSCSGSNVFGLFSTHPPIEKRIAILEQF